jgi:hypothetical protein
MYTLLRETPWIKEWQTPWGAFIDSKLRWLGVEPSAEAFIAAWQAADGPGKFDLEAAFEFYPYELEDDIDAILEFVARDDEQRAHRMHAKLFRPDSQLTGDQKRFLAGLGEHLDHTHAAMRLVGENRWFAAYANDAGFHIDSHVTSPHDSPTEDQLDAHIAASLSLAYRRILQTVKANMWLLEPRPGERPLPGGGGLG